jgi:KDO2-lipid IV(A) lauroyltransferase
MSQIIIGLIRAIGALPLALRRAVGYWLGTALYFCLRRERTIARLQIRRFLGIDPDLTVRKIFIHLAISAFESCNLAPILRNHESCISALGLDLVHNALAKKKGIVCLTAHFGCWDLLAAWALHRGFILRPIGRTARNSIAQSVLQTLRERYKIFTIWRSSKAGVAEIIQTLEAGNIVAALIDQDTKVKSIDVPFFGVSARTPSALVDLGLRRGCPIVAAVMVREDANKFVVKLKELDTSQGCLHVLVQYHDFLSELIRSHPEQWVWFHKRWRTRPDGKTLSGKDYAQFVSTGVDT